MDSLKRPFQCGTIQLDFNLPKRFDLKVKTEDGEERPIMIHRACLGSLERFIAILLENFSGKLPFWISPRQINIFSVNENANDYCNEIQKQLYDAGYYVDINTDGGMTLQKKIALSETLCYNFMIICGLKEKSAGTITIRYRGTKKQVTMSMEDGLNFFVEKRDSRDLTV